LNKTAAPIGIKKLVYNLIKKAASKETAFQLHYLELITDYFFPAAGLPAAGAAGFTAALLLLNM
jgi:hypothetical protein